MMDAKRLGAGQAAIRQLAAQSYMSGGFGTPLQVLTSSNGQTLMSRAAIMQQLQLANGDKGSALTTAEAAARPAHETAVPQAKRVPAPAGKVATKTRAIQAKVK